MLLRDMKFKIIYFNLLFFFIVCLTVFGFGFLLLKIADLSPAEAQVENQDIIPPKVTDIEILDTKATSSLITWKTDELADSLINYGLDKNYGISRDPHFDKKSHQILLEDLMPNTTYFFRITSSDSSGNQGISSDFTFTTPKDKEDETPKEGYAEEVMESGQGGLFREGEEIVKLIDKITSEEVIEKVQEELQKKAEEIVMPPTIILNYAEVEVGTDWARITWQTDKESNSIVALSEDAGFNAEAEDPYRWKEGEPEEMVTEHIVEVNGLRPATVYHFQVSSESAIGLTGKSTDKTFKTKSILPEISNMQIVKVEEDAATIRWMTNIPCSSILEYTNLNTDQTKLEGNSSFITAHSIRLGNLIYDTYYSVIIKVESEDGEKAQSDPITFITTRDQYAPLVTKVNTESTLYPGTENRIQTIISWMTDEISQCQLFYNQGLAAQSEPSLLPKEQDYALKHVQVVTNFLPATVYKFWIVCNDETNNSGKSEDYTMLTPTQEESIIDIIIKNFESSFGWVKKIKIN